MVSETVKLMFFVCRCFLFFVFVFVFVLFFLILGSLTSVILFTLIGLNEHKLAEYFAPKTTKIKSLTFYFSNKCNHVLLQ